MNLNDLKGPPEPSIPQPKRSRQQVQQEKQQNEEHTPERLRLIPIWLRLIIVVVLFFVAAIVGLIIGYSGIGDGQAWDALKWETWQHLLDIIEGKE